ncbi:MAG: TIGR04255 family protein [Bacteroidales bacterium]|jgi:uncharacterized protein (TIGR04255 family)|nr:TIGR04255 family protein [Bacteroidales bacterium]
MSKLPNAPLVEVVLELRWKIINKSDLSKIPYLYGDIYSLLKNKYPYRESIVPPEIPMDFLINQPVHRFRVAQNDYPLFQVGPGILTLNTIDSKYFWDSFSKNSQELIAAFLNVFPFQNEENISPSILFLDFFPFDFSKDDAYNFINDKFNIVFNQSFFPNHSFPKDLNLGFYYSISNGDLLVTLKKGLNNKKEEGIIMQTKVNGNPIKPELEEITLWFEKSHEICSEVFKNITKGELYKSFK